MRREIAFLSSMSFFIVLSLVSTSCAQPAPVVPTIPVAPTAPTAPSAPTKPTEPIILPGAEMVKDSLGRMVEKPQYGGQFTYAWTRAPVGFDEALVDTSNSWVRRLTQEDLVQSDWLKGPSGTGEWDYINPTTRLYESWVNSLAERWEIPDDETIIYHIRKGVHYWLNPNLEGSRRVGGRELTADDVVFSITREYNLDGKTPTAYTMRTLLPEEFPVSVKAMDKYTVVVKMQKGGRSSVIEYISDFMNVYPPEPLVGYPDLNDWRLQAGTGPFMLVDHVEGSASTFVRNPNYWMKDPLHPNNRLPYLDTVKMLVIVDRSTRMAAFRTGKIDHMGAGRDALLWDEAVTMRQVSPALKELRYPQYDSMNLSLRVDKPELPQYDLRVRRAIAMAIDQPAIARDYYGGNALLNTHPIIPFKGWEPMYTPVEQMPEDIRKLFEYHPDEAKKLLAEAGYPKGFKLEVLVQSDPRHIDLLSIVKDQLAKVGIEVVMDVRERTVFTSVTNSWAHKEAVFSTRANRALFLMTAWYPPATGNIVRINDPWYNEKVRPFVKENYLLNEPAVYPIMKEFALWTIGQAWMIEVPSSYFYAFWWPWLKGYNGEMVPGYTNDFTWIRFAWIDRDLKKSMGF